MNCSSICDSYRGAWGGTYASTHHPVSPVQSSSWLGLLHSLLDSHNCSCVDPLHAPQRAFLLIPTPGPSWFSNPLCSPLLESLSLQTQYCFIQLFHSPISQPISHQAGECLRVRPRGESEGQLGLPVKHPRDTGAPTLPRRPPGHDPAWYYTEKASPLSPSATPTQHTPPKEGVHGAPARGKEKSEQENQPTTHAYGKTRAKRSLLLY